MSKIESIPVPDGDDGFDESKFRHDKETHPIKATFINPHGAEIRVTGIYTAEGLAMMMRAGLVLADTQGELTEGEEISISEPFKKQP